MKEWLDHPERLLDPTERAILADALEESSHPHAQFVRSLHVQTVFVTYGHNRRRFLVSPWKESCQLTLHNSIHKAQAEIRDRILNLLTYPCTLCHATGWISVGNFPPQTCNHCSGTGRHSR